MNADEEQHITSAKAELRRIQNNVQTGGNNWDGHISAARDIIASVNSTSLMQRADRTADQTLITSGLQNLAYHNADLGGVQDIADWCVTQWLSMVQRDPENVDALQGLGKGWLSRSQPALARIHREEGSSSSGRSSGRPGTGNGAAYTSHDEARDAARAAAEADARIHTADYVEARGILLPSTEYFTRAITVAERRGTLTGRLLALAAEAYMSLGNVSYSYVNERYFRQALIYLRRASQLPDYTLSPYLQQYAPPDHKLFYASKHPKKPSSLAPYTDVYTATWTITGDW